MSSIDNDDAVLHVILLTMYIAMAPLALYSENAGMKEMRQKRGPK